MTDHLTAEDAARLLEGTTPGPWWAKGRVGGKRVIDLVRELVDDDEAPPHLAQDLDLIAAAPALAAALADSVPKAEHEAHKNTAEFVAVLAEAGRDAALAEVARLREARDQGRIARALYEWALPPHPHGVAYAPWDQCSDTQRRPYMDQAQAVLEALAEGSDVPPCPSCGMHSRTWPLSRCVDPFHGPVPGTAEGSDVLPTGGAEP